MKAKVFKTLIRIISIVLLLVFFIPCFTVSCSKQTTDISAMTATFGYKNSLGQTVANAQPGLLLLLLIPVLLLIITLVKKLNPVILSILTCGSSVVEFIIFIVFKSGVKSFAEKYYCNFETKFGYGLAITMCILLLIAGVGLLIGSMEKSGRIQIFETRTWKCPECGNENFDYFCTRCGIAKPKTCGEVEKEGDQT